MIEAILLLLAAEPLIENLQIPWDAEFAPDGSLFVSTRPGTLYVYDGELHPLLSRAVGGGEGGMLGVALHPDFDENRLLYVYYTDIHNRVERYVYSDYTLAFDKEIIGGIAASAIHNGGRIDFGPDGMLYVATGDAGRAELSRDISSLSGKILRMDPDGGVPPDNPIDDSLVYAYGLRNPQGMAWDLNGTMYVTDHGPSGRYGFAQDEINMIVPGGDYGWPQHIGSNHTQDAIPPLIHSGTQTWAPSGAAYIHDSDISWLDGLILYGALRGHHLGAVQTDGQGHQELLSGDRIRHVFQDDDGGIYIITSNTDGRGLPLPGDDAILKLHEDDMSSCHPWDIWELFC